MGTFGKTTSGAAETTIHDIVFGTEYTCPDAGQQADKITAYLKGDNSTTSKVKCALYKASDNSFVAATVERSQVFPVAQVAYDFTFSSPPAIGNENYIIVVWSDEANIQGAYSWTGANDVLKDDEAYNGFPDHFFDGDDIRPNVHMTLWGKPTCACLLIRAPDEEASVPHPSLSMWSGLGGDWRDKPVEVKR